MTKKFLLLLLVIVASVNCMFAGDEYRKGFQQYKLDNGLTVYLWEDHSMTNVLGQVVTLVGSIDEPEDYTGLAHYLEHMLFKGTQTISALDWEKEKPLYDDIVALYDLLNVERDPAKCEELIKQINEKSIEAAKYYTTDEFSNLTQGYGGMGLNANTSYDRTVYFNEFSAETMAQWMDLNSERLINPVFRSFQAELENVFEEYNMYQDMKNMVIFNYLGEKVYAGTPYGRSIIGYPEHLKNPSLSSLIKFYDTWYVPNNMALILLGNFNAEEAKPMIEEKFGRLVPKQLPERAPYTDTDFGGKQVYKAKISDYPMYTYIYKGVKASDPDDLLISFLMQLFNNGHQTGVFDKLMKNGDLSSASAQSDSRREAGRIMIMAIPYYDASQRKFESVKKTEGYIRAEIDKIKSGNIPEWLFNSVKNQMIMNFHLAMEGNSGDMANDARVHALTEDFIYGVNPEDDIFTQLERLEAITIDDIKRVAAQYFDADYITIEYSEGEPKPNKLAKPAIKPIEMPKGVESEYAKAFKAMPIEDVEVQFNNFNDVTETQLYNGVNLFYTPNTKNDVFSLTYKYGIGTKEMPKLRYAAALLNSAKIMGSNVDFHRQLSELGATCAFGVDDSYFYISVQGMDKNLREICNLVTRIMFMPDLDDKQIMNTINNELFARMNEKKTPSVLADALNDYVMFGQKSSYIDRLPVDELFSTATGEPLINKGVLTTTIQEAKKYAVDIHYCGTVPMTDAAEILKASSPIEENTRPSNSPYIAKFIKYDKPQVIFLPNSNVQQASVNFYAVSNPYKLDNVAYMSAFNEYFSGGFSGLVLNEIREKRSMAYTAYAYVAQRVRPDLDTYFGGYVGTQNDKVADAIDVFMDLVKNMPDNRDMLDNVKVAVKRSLISAKPSMRSKSQVFDRWKKMGYTDDPARTILPKIEALTYDQIRAYYEENVQGKPMTIVIMGDPKLINQKQIKAKYGKITKITANKLFKGGF